MGPFGISTNFNDILLKNQPSVRLISYHLFSGIVFVFQLFIVVQTYIFCTRNWFYGLFFFNLCYTFYIKKDMFILNKKSQGTKTMSERSYKKHCENS